MKRFLIILFFLAIIFPGLQAQQFRSGDTIINVMKALIVGEDTILVSDIPEVKIYPRRIFKNKYRYYRYRRLIRNVKAAYPYAKLAGKKLRELDTRLSVMTTDRQRKAYIKATEKDIRDEFEEKVTHLTVTQGRILIKLIDREMGRTSFFVLKDVKGGVKAVFWQGVARLFGSNLKSEYDPKDKDAIIEEIILMIEAGQL